jgi:preprotein translocase subunit SecF
MLDHIYSTLTSKVPYKTLTYIPILLSVLMLFVIYFNGLPMGIDFRGGTLIDVTLDAPTDSLSKLEGELVSAGLEDLKVYSGINLETGKTRISISTTTVNSSKINKTTEILTGYFGVLRDSDTATAFLNSSPPSDLQAKLRARLKENVDVSYNASTKTLSIVALDLNKDNLDSALSFYTNEKVSVGLQKRNLNMNQIQPSLGEKLRQDGFTAAFVGYILMAFVIVVAFRSFVPVVAVLLCATLDAVITIGFMSIFGIVVEPASLVALLMLVGYSVDTDVLLTTRMLKRKRGELNEGVDGAIKTGLTMTLTTLTVMTVVLLISTYVTHVATLISISSVLVIGLVADIATTWFMNAGIMKWYVEEKGAKLNLIKSKRKK